jgi:hypothetical protein
MEIIIDVLIIVLVLVVSNRVTKLKRETDADRKILLILAKESLKGEIGSLVENMKRGLENLFNPKDETKNNVKKTTTNRKTK